MNKIPVVIGEQDEQFLVHLVNIMENGFKEYICLLYTSRCV